MGRRLCPTKWVMPYIAGKAMKLWRGYPGREVRTDSKKPQDYIEDWSRGHRIHLRGKKDKTKPKETDLWLEIDEEDVFAFVQALAERSRLREKGIKRIREFAKWQEIVGSGSADKFPENIETLARYYLFPSDKDEPEQLDGSILGRNGESDLWHTQHSSCWLATKEPEQNHGQHQWRKPHCYLQPSRKVELLTLPVLFEPGLPNLFINWYKRLTDAHRG